MDAATLADVMYHRRGVDYNLHIKGCNEALSMAECTTVARAAMFLAQVGTESIGLGYSEEIASGVAYEGRRDLGNVLAGDGPRFKGRTFIQITGRNNYTRLSSWAYQHDLIPTEHYFIDHPDKLADPRYVWLGPVWYWTVARPGLNHLADLMDIQGATRAVNGGLNGLADRTMRWRHALSLGNAILPHPPTHNTDWFDNMDEATFDRKLRAVQDALNRSAARGGSLYVQFVNCPKSPKAVYRVDGGVLIWIDAATYLALQKRYGGEPYRVGLTTSSVFYRLPTASGTIDPRK